MTTILVWLLLVAPNVDYGSNKGNVAVLERFASVEQCEHVRKHISPDARVVSKCVQANIVVIK